MHVWSALGVSSPSHMAEAARATAQQSRCDEARLSHHTAAAGASAAAVVACRAAEAGTGARRRLLQAEDASFFVKTNSNQSVAITDANYQGGKAIIHIVDGVLIPASLAGNYSLTDIPGASNATAEETTELDAAGANATEPSANATSAAGGAAAPAPAPTPAPKSSAGAAVATLLAAPALLAVLML